MPAVTIGQAEAALANMAGLSDNQRHQFQAEITEARTAATKAGEEAAARIAADVAEVRDGLLEDLCAVRDGYAAAQAAGDRSTMADLRARHRTLLAKVEEVEHLTEQVAAIEEDPVAYGEAILAKYPSNARRFSFI